MEDFNRLLLAEQVELIRAQSARTKADRIAHRKEALNIARKIEEHRFPYRSPDSSGHRRFDAHLYDEPKMEMTAH